MTKQKLQQELQEKVKEGVKPSDIKKLKRSKSLGDIPSAPPLPLQNKDDKKTIALLSAENGELFKELTETKKQLEQVNQDWANLAQQRVESLKKVPNPRIVELERELEQTVKDATTEITRQETEIKQLRIKLVQVNNQNQDLVRQVNNYQRAAEFRLNNPFPEKEPNSNWWSDYGMIILLLALYGLSYWLLNQNKSHKNYNE